ncbi:MAG TPA: transketolase C-terminal domain-containing protein [Vicinamibacterales bacterium]|nr:transketolase C-terminal domain-containing protein [Vicinamibacterales bacterium]
MGEQQLDVVTADDLYYAPVSEFARLRAKQLDVVEEARTFAALARLNTLYMIARAWSGHIGTSFSSLEIISWLFLREMRNLDKGPQACDVFFSSKGHDAPALYNVLIALGLMDADKIHHLRRLHGLPGHPHVETPYIQANTGSLGMGISKAKGMVLANRLLGVPQKIFVLTGDGELQEGQFWESLQSAVNLGLHEITAIIDHNKIQSDTWVEEVSDLGSLEAKLRAFGWHVERVDGHDLDALQRVFRTLDAVTDKPKIVIADTVKGKGVSFMEGPAMKDGELYNYHSGAPNEEEYAKGSNELIAHLEERFRAHGLGKLKLETARRPARKPVLKVERLVFAYTQALLKQAERHPQIIALDADLVKDCGLVDFRARFPDRFVECGIAEQDMVSMACGMAHRGALPIAHSFACFLAARPNEQIYNQCSESSKVIYVGSLAGLLPGGPGHSHQSVRDISALGSVPKLILAEPCTEQEVDALVDFMVNGTEESSYLRLVSLGWPVPFTLPNNYRAELGRGVVVREGTDAVVFGYGPWLLANAWEAAERLNASGVRVKLVNLPWLNRLDSAWLRDVIGSARQIVTLDNHYVHGGQGDMIAARIAELGLSPAARVTRLGVAELPQCGTNDEVLQYHKLDVDGLFETMRSTLRAPVS